MMESLIAGVMNSVVFPSERFVRMFSPSTGFANWARTCDLEISSGSVFSRGSKSKARRITILKEPKISVIDRYVADQVRSIILNRCVIINHEVIKLQLLINLLQFAVARNWGGPPIKPIITDHSTPLSSRTIVSKWSPFHYDSSNISGNLSYPPESFRHLPPECIRVRSQKWIKKPKTAFPVGIGIERMIVVLGRIGNRRASDHILKNPTYNWTVILQNWFALGQHRCSPTRNSH
jgi:hypothetical protein